jgi:hypothetical protein
MKYKLEKVSDKTIFSQIRKEILDLSFQIKTIQVENTQGKGDQHARERVLSLIIHSFEGT